MSVLLTSAKFLSSIEPYKRILGVLIRTDCVSVAVSNPYWNLAEPRGGVMLRQGRLSGRAFQRLIQEDSNQLAGLVVGVQDGPRRPEGLSQAQLQVLQQVKACHPGLLVGWWGDWQQDGPASCRIVPQAAEEQPHPQEPSSRSSRQQQAGMAAAAQAQLSNGSTPSGMAAAAAGPAALSAAGQQCCVGQLFLQDFLDSLGTLNTFG